MSERVLKAVVKRLDKKLKEQSQNALSSVYKDLGCSGVAREIKAGKNVTGNAAYGFKYCLHGKIGPTYNPITDKFFPMTARNKQIQKKFEKGVNGLLESGGFKPMPSNLIPNLRKQDKAFKQKVKKRKKRKK